jgi:uncharacterized membrane protein
LFETPCPDDPAQRCGEGNARDINKRGDVVGSARGALGFDRPVIWREGGQIAELNVFPNEEGAAERINDRGQVVGFTVEHGWFLWENGAFQSIPRPSLFERMWNDRTQIVGFVRDADGRAGAYVWTDGQIVDLAAGLDAVFSDALVINDAGEIAGYYLPTGGSGIQTLLWRPVRGTAQRTP